MLKSIFTQRIKRVVSVAIITAIALTLLSTIISAQNKTSAFNHNDFYTSVFNSEEFKSIDDNSLRIKMLQLPDDAIKQMDTATLAKAVLDYPFFTNIYAYDDVHIGAYIQLGINKGYQELSKRPDAARVLLDMYIAFEIIPQDKAQYMDDITLGNAVIELNNLEVLLAQDFVTQNLDDKELTMLDESVLAKFIDKSETPAYGTATTAFYDVFFATCRRFHKIKNWQFSVNTRICLYAER